MDMTTGLASIGEGKGKGESRACRLWMFAFLDLDGVTSLLRLAAQAAGACASVARSRQAGDGRWLGGGNQGLWVQELDGA
jgi:hypothetical protein